MQRPSQAYHAPKRPSTLSNELYNSTRPDSGCHVSDAYTRPVSSTTAAAVTEHDAQAGRPPSCQLRHEVNNSIHPAASYARDGVSARLRNCDYAGALIERDSRQGNAPSPPRARDMTGGPVQYPKSGPLPDDIPLAELRKQISRARSRADMHQDTEPKAPQPCISNNTATTPERKVQAGRARRRADADDRREMFPARPCHTNRATAMAEHHRRNGWSSQSVDERSCKSPAASPPPPPPSDCNDAASSAEPRRWNGKAPAREIDRSRAPALHSPPPRQMDDRASVVEGNTGFSQASRRAHGMARATAQMPFRSHQKDDAASVAEREMGGSTPPRHVERMKKVTAKMPNPDCPEHGSTHARHKKTPKSMELMEEDKPKTTWADRGRAVKTAWNFVLLQWFGFENGECFGGC